MSLVVLRARLTTPMPIVVRFGSTPEGNPCHQVPANIMFPGERGDPDGIARALKVCQRCPLTTRTACLEWALENPHIEGVWGGRSLKHRRKILEDRKKAAANRATVTLMT